MENMNDEEKKAIEQVLLSVIEAYSEYEDLQKISEEYKNTKTILNLIEKQSKEIEEYKKQLDLNNECEIALNSKVMDLEKEIEELKDKNKTLKNLQNDTNGLYIGMIERKNYFERELQKFEDKIKAKIEESELLIDNSQGCMSDEDLYKEFGKIEFGKSLLEKE
jgi:uncharacterized phage infection (PIP) family protein YhgE